ncbi:hypothetical protein NEMBOFW57_002820 [Staphylotrichum longicolle]|uniref:Uncharacterized protein n=1 Tax=Staphylotrichum longicolle TaxID=669026 RepID=A0AAD4F8Q9_9PEZI|nr:hypothetical protein NEMBOFW57_002820 [Staphylotrichum longicolle]
MSVRFLGWIKHRKSDALLTFRSVKPDSPVIVAPSEEDEVRPESTAAADSPSCSFLADAFDPTVGATLDPGTCALCPVETPLSLRRPADDSERLPQVSSGGEEVLLLRVVRVSCWGYWRRCASLGKIQRGWGSLR